MAGEGIFSGILRPRQGSRPIDPSFIGEERRHRQAQEAAEKAAAKKQQDANMKEVMKNLYVEPKFNNSVLNRHAYQEIGSAINDVVQMSASGDSAAWAQSMNRVQKVKAKLKELEEIDTNWTATATALTKAKADGKSSWLTEPVVIDAAKGKQYSNYIEFMNDPANDGNAAAQEEARKKFGVEPFVSFREQPTATGIGNYFVYQAPEASVFSDPTAAVKKMATGDGAAPMYTDKVGEEILKVGGKTELTQYMGIGPVARGAITSSTFENPEYMTWALNEGLPAFMQQNPNLSRGEAISSYLRNVSSDKAFAQSQLIGGMQKMDNFIKSLRMKGPSAEYTPPSNSNDPMARAKKIFGQGTRSEDGKYIEFSVRGQDQRPVNVTTYTGTQIRPIGGGTWKPVPKGQIRPDQELQMVAWGNSLADSHILYTSKIDASGAKGELDEVYELKMPVSGQSHGQLAANIGVDADVLAEFFLSNSSETPPEFVRNFLQSMGKSSEGLPGAGPKGASATKAGTSSNPKSKWESAKR